MPLTQPDEIQSWLEDNVRQKPKRFDLRRRLDGARVQMWSFTEGEDLVELGKRILQAAQRDGLGQPQKDVRYSLRADCDGDEDGLGTCTVTVPGGHAKGRPEGEETEISASRDQTIIHILKQNAELHRLLVASQEGRTLGLERQNEALVKRIDDAEKRHMQLVMLTDSLAIAKMEREMQIRHIELEETRQRYVSGKIDGLLPIALNRLMGGGPGKGAPMSDEMVHQLLGKMDAESVEAAMKGELFSLTEEQRALFAELYVSQGAKHRARERNLNSNGTPKTDETNGAPPPDKDKPS